MTTPDPRDRNHDGHVSAAEHIHDYLARRSGPIKTVHVLTGDSRIGAFNDWLALQITHRVGTMWAAYIFAALALTSLPQAIEGGVASMVTWVAQTFLQLVLLSVIIAGQNLQGRASEARTVQGYQDISQALLGIGRLEKAIQDVAGKLTGGGNG